VFVADTATSEVYRLESGRPPVPLSGGMLEVPTGLAVAPTGDLLVTDLRLGLIARVPRDGGRPVTIATVPSPRGLALSPEGEPVVLSMGPSSVLRVNQDGKVVPLVTGKPFRFPCCILADPDHAGYLVSDSYGASIWAVSERGEVRVRIQGSPLVRPEGLAREPSGALLVADPGAGQVFRVGEGGAVQPLLPQLPKDEISQRGPCAGHSIERDTSR
jgi:glucose/arabinose dehydrogenase